MGKRKHCCIIKVNSHRLVAEYIVGYKRTESPHCLKIFLSSGHTIELNKAADITKFRNRFSRYLQKSGIEVQHEL